MIGALPAATAVSVVIAFPAAVCTTLTPKPDLVETVQQKRREKVVDTVGIEQRVRQRGERHSVVVVGVGGGGGGDGL